MIRCVEAALGGLVSHELEDIPVLDEPCPSVVRRSSSTDFTSLPSGSRRGAVLKRSDLGVEDVSDSVHDDIVIGEKPLVRLIRKRLVAMKFQFARVMVGRRRSVWFVVLAHGTP